ncbi:MAG: hypothetical protein J5616_00335 [Bacteroidaceae bacterium]|nr:hypothetical protein [Bacteroidaceae bacterium]
MKRLFYLFVFLMSFTSGILRAQHLSLSDSVVTGSSDYVNLVRLMQRVWMFNQEVPQEKVYLHFDNTGYFKGEKMWFKAYVVRTDTGKPTDMSAVLYAELLNPSGEVIQSRKLHIEKGEAIGDFTLDTLYVTGFYEVRAYTRYMMNWGGTGIFSRVFPIFKQPRVDGDYSRMELDKFSYRKRQPNYREVPLEILDEKAAEKNLNQLTMKRLPHGKVHVNFYPEGGNLVEGLPSRVAFAVNDDEGRYFDAEGVVLDEQKQLVQGAVTYRDGRGYFSITPDDEPKYLQLTTADGKKQEFELPEAIPQGISLTLNTLHDPDVLATMTSSVAMQHRMLGYTLMHEGRIIACDTISCRPKMALAFPRDSLPAGVNQLTFFDSDGHVMAERLFFICPKLTDEERVVVTTPNDHLVPCGKVRINIQTSPNARLSFSAMDMATLTNGKEGNALTWMLLSSEVKGYIAHPEYYFESDDREHRLAADLLMMVQGWRRYRWDLMAGNERFERLYNIEDRLYIQGQLLQHRKNIPVVDEPLRAYLFWVNHETRTGEWVSGDAVTDSLGRFAFEMPDAWYEWNLQVMVKNTYKFGKVGTGDHRQDFRVLLDRHFAPQPRWLSPYETDTLASLHPNLFEEVPDSLLEELENLPILKREHVLKEVKVKAFRRIFDDARAAWEDENHGRHWASIYYNVDKEVDEINDKGGAIPGVMEWLYGHNPLFQAAGDERFLPTQLNENVINPHIKGESSGGTALNSINPSAYGSTSRVPAISSLSNIIDFGALMTPIKNIHHYSPEIYRDGLSYKGRPVIWILNNIYAGITCTHNMFIRDLQVFDRSLQSFPIFLDEVKSIYITENKNAPDRYMYSSDVMAKDPVTVFVYTHLALPWKKNGLRRTHFQAYDKPDTFEMDDYSKVPPMEDFRRTIYWKPDVETDAQGRATIEFWNNSSAHRLFISAEGMTPDGKILTNEMQ